MICRKDAIAAGLDRYYTGKPCHRGHLSERYTKTCTCIECHKITAPKWQSDNRIAVNAAAARWRKNNPDAARAARAAARNKRKEQDRAYRSQWQREHQEQHAAHNAVWRAIKNGTLVPQPCERCCSTHDIHAHHEDHSKRLEVTWLCRSCHAKRHSEILSEKIMCGLRA